MTGWRRRARWWGPAAALAIALAGAAAQCSGPDVEDWVGQAAPVETWSDWERRLVAARVAWWRLQQAGHLSPVQREAEMASHLRAHFRPDELPRVKALLAM
jgi:hypothetical protein